MKLSLILILFLLLVPVSSAKQESLIMGPYKVSFNLNTTQAYSINNTTVIYGETYGGTSYVIYQATINPTKNIAVITVTYFAHEMNKNIDRIKSDMHDNSIPKFNDYDTYDRIIDGQSGVLGVGKSNLLGSGFEAEYWPMFNTTGDTGVRITSFLPWDNGTLNLLKTIHVEMVGKPPI